jgi:hypothetical protein
MRKPGGKKPAVLPGQIYEGVATRYVFPPDAGSWWHTHGSYAIAIVSAGRIWFEYASFLITANGAITRLAPPMQKRARLEEFRKELESGAMTLRRPEAPRITLYDDSAALPPTEEPED